MDSRQLYRAAKSDKTLREYGFLGVFSPDTIPIKALTTSPCSLISNTQDSDKDGEHWVALTIDDNGRGWYFDSFGAPPKLEEFLSLLNSCSEWSYNTRPIQSLLSTTCGQYCLFYLLHSARGYGMDDIVDLLDQDDDQYVNDAIVNKFIKNYFNESELEVTDFPFVFSQAVKYLQ